ncbi:acyl-CoA dehydrogenase [Variovorax saccharolyticus]|uniref:acyl-CoA dehydrogenase n=1 Tax=Variovorax saccharolyticus TaxID=3053516 RepID=UPI002576AB19|nr:acyl-CoA dehydrogenase [Variovorax sp. J22R187]MDM0019347.1 acyl-CoA dehydrogenase [Variovorax sp. J22R187]
MPAPEAAATLERLRARHREALSLEHLVDAGVDRLPLPGSGATLERWRMLSEVAAHDLSLVKLFEGHTDALAIRRELGAADAVAGTRWATWCAEPPDARVTLEALPAHRSGPAPIRLHGTKAWCSGARSVTHAVVSCWNAEGEPCLAEVALGQPAVIVTDEGWHAVGMAGSGSVDVRFEGAAAHQIGRPGDYVRRPGFWQGGAGIAACWFGGALGIARQTRGFCGTKPDAHRLAHLGAIDTALSAAAAVLRESAAWIDARPGEDARQLALRLRLVVEDAAHALIAHACRATGAAPLCRDARFARAVADLPVFMRQSHAERDLAALGECVLDAEATPWKL